MSEYQYYEFQTIDRPLTAEERRAVGKLSSHIDVHSSSASVEYSWGDFKHDPLQVVADYFDAMIYVTNWGTHQILFRFPKAAVDTTLWQPYLCPDSVTIEDAGEYLILNIFMDSEEGGDWVDTDGLLSSLIPLRNDLLHGDLRALYLAWLQYVSIDPEAEYGDGDEDEDDYAGDDDEDDEDDSAYTDYAGGGFRIKGPPGRPEPPLPPGLKKLTPALRSLVEFLEIDEDLLVAAAAASPTLKEQSQTLTEFIPRLSDAEKNDFLTRLLDGEAHLELTLKARLRALRPAEKVAAAETPRRTIQSVFEAADARREQKQNEELQRQQAAHAKRMNELEQQEPHLWTMVEYGIAQKNARGYTEAVTLLRDLHLLAQYQQRMPEFKARVEELRATYGRSRALMDRLKEFP